MFASSERTEQLKSSLKARMLAVRGGICTSSVCSLLMESVIQQAYG